jgi:protein gp37
MSKIEWTNITWNPVTGCSAISPGCENCYAKPMSRRLRGMEKSRIKYRNGFKVTCHSEELDRDFGRKPKKIFVNSMSDLFHEDVSFEFNSLILRKIAMNPEHIFQILTKRPERALQFSNWLLDQGATWPGNVWLGVTVETEKQLGRIDVLKSIPCSVKFVSFEPLLGEIDVPNLTGIDWIIVGAETGRKARYMEPDWALKLKGQSGSIPFFFKKMSNNGTIPPELFPRQSPSFQKKTSGKSIVIPDQ